MPDYVIKDSLGFSHSHYCTGFTGRAGYSTALRLDWFAREKESHQKCDYCGSRCEDSRGNCGACGAPK